MAQFSPNTVGYDVAVYKISGFFDKYYNSGFKTHEEFLKECQILLQSISGSAGNVITNYEPVTKRTTTKVCPPK